MFALMFPDNAIVSKLTVGSTKLAYVITQGLAPYFHSSLTTTLYSYSEYVICFNEAHDDIVQKPQMDIVVRHWDSHTNLVNSRYGRLGEDEILHAFY